MKCIDCKYYKAYTTIQGGLCGHKDVKHRDIEYPNSYWCKRHKTNLSLWQKIKKKVGM